MEVLYYPRAGLLTKATKLCRVNKFAYKRTIAWLNILFIWINDKEVMMNWFARIGTAVLLGVVIGLCGHFGTELSEAVTYSLGWHNPADSRLIGDLYYIARSEESRAELLQEELDSVMQWKIF